MIRPACLCIVTLLLSAPVAVADHLTTMSSSGTVRGPGPMPSDGYAGQHWTHPIGCDYSRAGRPGEIVWYLIVNTRRPGCPPYVVQRGFGDIY